MGHNSGIQHINRKMPVSALKALVKKGIASAGAYEHKISILNVSPKKVKKNHLKPNYNIKNID